MLQLCRRSEPVEIAISLFVEVGLDGENHLELRVCVSLSAMAEH